MDETAKKALADLTQAFAGETGPACESLGKPGEHWYEWEGRGMESALLSLDPIDIQAEDLEFENGAVIPFASDSGLKWLIPGIVRVAFEEADKGNARYGDEILEDLFSELERRASERGLTLTREQMKGLVEGVEVFYSTEPFDWDVEANMKPFVEGMRKALREAD